MANRLDNPLEWTVEDFKARAHNARYEAHTLVTRAEIWEDAASRLEVAIEKAQKQSSSADGEPR